MEYCGNAGAGETDRLLGGCIVVMYEDDDGCGTVTVWQDEMQQWICNSVRT